MTLLEQVFGRFSCDGRDQRMKEQADHRRGGR
jgi:hypothetical protein